MAPNLRASASLVEDVEIAHVSQPMALQQKQKQQQQQQRAWQKGSDIA